MAIPARAQTTYYVNDGSTVGDVFTTAVGNDANSGLTPALPKATVQNVVSTYALGPGDIIRIDTGSYDLASSITITATDDGDATGFVTIEGAVSATGALLANINDNNDNYQGNLFYLNGSSYVRLKNLDIGPTGSGPNEDGVIIENATNDEVVGCTIRSADDFNLLIWKTSAGAAAGNHLVSGCVIRNSNSSQGIQITRQTGCRVEKTAVYGNTGGNGGVQVFDGSTGASIVNCSFIRNRQNSAGVDVSLIFATNCSGAAVRDCIFYIEDNGDAQTDYGIYFSDVASQTGFSSNYNTFYRTGAAVTGFYNGANQTTLATWQTTTGQDAQSINLNPQFVNAAAGSEDLHLLSTYGYFTVGGSWSISGATNSPCIDAGEPDATSPFDWASEPEDNGNRIDMGAYGGTSQASHSGPAIVPAFGANSTLSSNYWTGAGSAAWTNHGNWAHGIPTAANDAYGVVVDRMETDGEPGTLFPDPVNAMAPTAADADGTCYSFALQLGTITIADTANDWILNIGAGGFSQTAGTLAMAGAGAPPEMIVCAGNWSQTAGTFTPTGGRVRFNGTVAQTVSLTAGNFFWEFEVNGTGNVIQPLVALRMDGGLLITSATFDVNAFTHDVNGPATLTGGTLEMNAAADAITISGSWTESGTFAFAATAGTVTFDGGLGLQNVTHLAANNFWDVIVNKSAGTLAPLSVIDVDGNLTLTAGTFDNGAFTHTVAGNFSQGGGTLNMDSSSDALDVEGTFTVTAGSAAFLAASASKINVAGNISIASAGWAPAGPDSNFIFMDGAGTSGTPQTISVATGNAATVVVRQTANTNFARASGSVNTLRLHIDRGIFEPNGQTVNVTSTTSAIPLMVGDTDAAGALTEGELRIGSGTVDLEGNFLLRNSGVLTMTGGTFFAGDDFLDERAAGSFSLTGGTITLDRATTHDLRLRTSDALWNVTFSPTSSAGKVRPYDDGVVVSALFDINGNLTINNGEWRQVAETGTLANVALDLEGNFTLGAGSNPGFVAGTATHTVAGNWIDDSASTVVTGFRPAAGTMRLDGTAATITIKTSGANGDLDNNSAGNHFYNLEIAAGASSVVQFQDPAATTHSALEVNGNLTILSGTLKIEKTAAGAEQVDVDGTITMTGGRLEFWSLSDLSVAGDVAVNGGTFLLRASGTSSPTARLAGGAAGFVVNSGGTFQTISTTVKPTLTWNGATRFEFKANSGSTVYIQGLNFSGCDGSGLHIAAGATLTDIDTVDFTNGAGNLAPPSSNRFLWIEVASGAFSFTSCSFDTTTDYNMVRAAGSTATFDFSLFSGAGSDDPFEWDLASAPDGTPGTFTPGQIRWKPTRDWTGAVNSDWSNSGNWTGGIIPAVDGSDDARIPGGMPNYPLIDETAALGAAGAAATFNLGVESGGTVTMSTGSGGILHVTQGLKMSAGSTLASNNGTEIRIAGDWRTAGTFTIGGGTGWVIFNGSANQTIAIAESFPNLRINNSGTADVIVSAAITISGALELPDDSGLDITGVTMDVAGNFTTDGGVEFIVTGSTVRFRRNTAGTQTIGGSANPAFNNVEVGGGAAANTVDTARDIDVDANFTIQSNGTYWLSGDTMNLAGNFSIVAGGVFTSAGSTIFIDGTTDQTIAGATYQHVTIANTGGAEARMAAAAGLTFDVNGSFTLSSGSQFNIQGNNMTVAGNFFTANASSIWIAPTAGTVTFDGSGSQTLSNGTGSDLSFNNLTISNTSGSAGVTLSGNLDVNGTLTVNNSDGTANVDFSLGSATVKIGAGLTRTGHMNVGTSTIVLDGGATTLSGSANDFNNLTIAGATATLGAAADINGNLLISSGTFGVGAGNFAITLAGNWTNTGGTFNEGTGTVTLDGGGAQTVGTETFYNLTVNKGAGTATISGSVAASATLTLTNGTLSLVGGQTLRIGTAFTQTGGALEMSGSTPSVTSIDTAAPTYYAWTMSGGTINVSGANIAYTNGNGVSITAAFANILAFNTVTFSNHQNTGGVDYFLNVSTSGTPSASKTFTGVTFGTHVSASDKDVRLNDTDADGDPNDLVITFSNWASSYSVEASRETEVSARIDWSNSVNWIGKWRYRRAIPIASGSLNDNVFVRFAGDGGTTAMVSSSPDATTIYTNLVSPPAAHEIRVVYYDADVGRYFDCDRQIVRVANKLIELYFKMPATFAAGDTVYLYYNATAPTTGTTYTARNVSFSDNFDAGSATGWDDNQKTAFNASFAFLGGFGVEISDSGAGDGFLRKNTTLTTGTAEVWSRVPEASVATRRSLASQDSTNAILWDLGFSGGNIKYFNGTWNNFTTPIPYTVGTWYDLRVDYTDATKTFNCYVNGVLQSPTNIAYAAAQSVAKVALTNTDGGGSLVQFDEFVLYSSTPNASFSGAAALTDITAAAFNRWGESINWSPISVPNATVDVFVNAGYTYNPVSEGAAQSLASMSLGTATGAPTLTVNGNLNAAGSATIGSLGATVNGTGTLSIARDWTTSGTFTHSSGTIAFNGSINQTITGATTFNNLTLNNSGAAGNDKLTPGANVTVNANLTVTDGTLTWSGNTVSVSGDTTVAAAGAISMSATAQLKHGDVAAGSNLNISGSFTASPVGTDKPTLTRIGAGTIDANFLPGSTVNITGLTFSFGDTEGMNFDNAIFTNLKGVTFSNVAAAPGRYMTFTDNALTLTSTDMYFTGPLTGPPGGPYNVYAVDTDGGDDVRITLEFRDAATHGTGAGEPYDFDDDADADGFSSGGGAVVNWVYAAGSIVGYPQGASWYLSSFAWYATYMAVKNANGLSYVQRLDAAGNVSYAYSFSESTYGEIVGVPWWDNNDTNRWVYFGTSGGWLFRLADSGGALTLVAGWPVNLNAFAPPCLEVTSPVISDATRVYFGGRENGVPVYRMFAVADSAAPPGGWTWSPNPTVATAVRTAPVLTGGAGSNLYAASNVVAGAAHAYRITASSGAVTADNTTSKAHDMRAPLSYGSGDALMVVGDYGGRLQIMDTASPTLANWGSFPYLSAPHALGAVQVRASILWDWIEDRAMYGDSDGHIYVIDSTATEFDPDGIGPLPAYPRQFEAGVAISAAPMYLGGLIYTGNENGKVYVIDRSNDNAAPFVTLRCGPGVIVGDMAYLDLGAPFPDVTADKIAFSASNGRMYFFSPYTDPTP